MAAIDRDLSDASAELAAHGITRDASEQRKGATAPLLQKWAASHQQALIEHRQVDVRAVEEHFLLQDCVPYEGQRAVEHYFCSDLVADVLHECGVLHSAVRDRCSSSSALDPPAINS